MFSIPKQRVCILWAAINTTPKLYTSQLGVHTEREIDNVSCPEKGTLFVLYYHFKLMIVNWTYRRKNLGCCKLENEILKEAKNARKWHF